MLGPKLLEQVKSMWMNLLRPTPRGGTMVSFPVSDQADHMKLNIFQQQVFFCTARIVAPVAEGRVSVGTGFFVQAPVTDDRNVILLVSNKHVFPESAEEAYMELHKVDPDSSERKPLLGQTSRAQLRLRADGYVEHPDKTVDLACINVSGISRPELGIYYRTLPLEMSATFEEDWLLPNAEVCFVGYPDGRYDTTHNLPILRRGVIATIPSVDFNGIPQFVVDASVYQGSSGSPVFAQPPFGGPIKFLGVITETMVRGEELRTLPTNVRLGVHQLIGLGLVLKAQLVRDLVEHAVANTREALAAQERSQPTVSTEVAERAEAGAPAPTAAP